jgi:internalin A
LKPEEKAYLYSLVHSGRSGPNREIENRLLLYGILKRDGDQTRISSLLFKQWIRLDAPTPIEPKPPATHLPETPKKYENAAFVSYAWGDESGQMVDELERAFKKQSINLIRDKKDLEYTGSIEEFERRIGQGRCVVLVISDKYLRSKHCMFELMLVNKKRNLRKRVFPIILPDAGIFDEVKRLEYIKHWRYKIDELVQAIINTDELTNVDGSILELKKYRRIRDEFDHLTTLLKDMNALTPEIHAREGFITLINSVKKTMGGT